MAVLNQSWWQGGAVGRSSPHKPIPQPGKSFPSQNSSKLTRLHTSKCKTQKFHVKTPTFSIQNLKLLALKLLRQN